MTATARIPSWADPLDVRDHRIVYPTPPVSRAADRGTAPAVVGAASHTKGPAPLTVARLDAMRGRGRLTTKQVQSLWLKAGVPAGDGGPLTMLRHYLAQGWVERPVEGSRNVASLWEVVS